MEHETRPSLVIGDAVVVELQDAMQCGSLHDLFIRNICRA